MNELLRFLCVLGCSVLSSLFGVGAVWILTAIFYVGQNDERLTKVMPLLFAGGMIGFIVGAICAARAVKANLEIKNTESKFSRGDSDRIFLGVPFFVFAIFLFVCGEKFFIKFGNMVGAYLYLGVFLGVIIICMVLRDSMPKKFIIPAGIIGWLLTFALAVWFGILRTRT